MSRFDGRADAELRPIQFHRNFTDAAAGSVLVEVGRTKILCTVSAVPGAPTFQMSKGEGWLTAEYAMQPGAVEGRKPREIGKRDGRSVEIQRLIGRSLRSVVDLSAFPNWTLYADCDVLQADGGTRCASITGACVALHDALKALAGRDQLRHWPLHDWVAAISTGLVGNETVLDLNYGEDFDAAMDMNVVATEKGKIIEVQATAERDPIPKETFDRLVDLGLQGVRELVAHQKAAVEAGLTV